MDKKVLCTFPTIDVQLTCAENYNAWALIMQYNLRAFGPWVYVQSTLECPSLISTTPTTPPSDIVILSY